MRRVPGAVRGNNFEAAALAPLGEPLQELYAGKADGLAFGSVAAIRFGKPLDEFPIRRAEQLLLVRRTLGQLEDFGKGPEFVSRPRAKEVEMDCQLAETAKLGRGLHGAADAEPRAWGIQVRRRGRKEPVFQLLHNAGFMLGLLDFGEPIAISVRGEFGRNGPI